MSRQFPPSVIALLVALVAVGGGCRKSAAPTVKITIDYPGASPGIVSDLIGAPVLQYLIGVDGAVVCVSSAERVEVYVHGNPGSDVATLARSVGDRVRLAVPALPDTAKVGAAKDASGMPFPPVVKIRDVDRLDIKIDREKLAKFGIRLSDVSGALNDAPDKHANGKDKSVADSAKRVKELTVKGSDGKTHRLSDFAEIRVVREPDHCVLRWPSDKQQESQ